MKKLITSSILALGASGLMLMAQSSSPTQTPPTQQNSTTGDSQMSSKIRQAIMNDNTTQPVAHNVRVTTHNGTVTLRGKVDSTEEKDAVVAKAKQIAGDANVKDELTVAKK